MPLLKKIIKSDPREVIVKWTGTGSDTLTLASLVSTGQTLTGATDATASILAISSTQANGNTLTITRNAEEAIHAHGNFEFQTDGIVTAVLNENSTFDIVVQMNGTGTLILRVKKTQGYTGI